MAAFTREPPALLPPEREGLTAEQPLPPEVELWVELEAGMGTGKEGQARENKLQIVGPSPSWKGGLSWATWPTFCQAWELRWFWGNPGERV